MEKQRVVNGCFNHKNEWIRLLCRKAAKSELPHYSTHCVMVEVQVGVNSRRSLDQGNFNNLKRTYTMMPKSIQTNAPKNQNNLSRERKSIHCLMKRLIMLGWSFFSIAIRIFTTINHIEYQSTILNWQGGIWFISGNCTGYILRQLLKSLAEWR